MSQRIASLYAEISADTTKLKGGLEQARGELKKTQEQTRMFGTMTQKQFSSVTTALGGVAAGFGAVYAAGKLIYNQAKSAAQLEYSQKKFDNLAVSINTTSEALRTDLADATDGLMSNAKTIQLAGDLMSLGLAKTHDEAVRLTIVASQLNMDMNELVLTLTNQTTRRFDQLGVSTDGFKEKLAGLEAQGYNTQDAFKEAFLQQAEAQIERVGSVSDTALGSMMRFEAATEDLGNAIKQKLLPPVVTTVENVTMLVTAQDKLNDTYDEAEERITDTSESYDEYLRRMLIAKDAMGETIVNAEEMFKAYQSGDQQITQMIGNMDILDDRMWGLAYVQAQAAQTNADYAQQTTAAAEATEEAAAAAEDAVTRTDALKQAVAGLADAYDDVFSAANKDFSFTNITADVAFNMAGGDIFGDIEESFQGIAVWMNDLNPELQKFFQQGLIENANMAQLAYLKLQVQLGNLTPYKAAREAAQELGMDYNTVIRMMQDEQFDFNKLLSGTNSYLKTLQAIMLGLNGMTAEMYVNIITTGSLPSVRGGQLSNVGANQHTSNKTQQTGTVAHAEGGQLGRGWSMVGERGFELIDPTGYVYTNEESRAMLAAGFVPGTKRAIGGALGGPIIDGTGGIPVPDTREGKRSPDFYEGRIPRDNGGAPPITPAAIANIVAEEQATMTSAFTSKVIQSNRETQIQNEKNSMKIVDSIEKLIAKTGTAQEIGLYTAEGVRNG